MVSESWQLDRKFKGEVLILVVVEDGLRDADAFFFNASSNRLNPCCGGRWSQRYFGVSDDQKNLS